MNSAIKKIILSTAIMPSFIISSLPAMASETDLQQQITNMKVEMKKQSTLLKKQAKMLEKLQSKLDLNSKDKIMASGNKSSDDIKISYNKGLELKNKEATFTIKPVVRVQADAAFIKDDKNDYSTGSTIRRARLGFKGSYNKNWHYNMVADFADDKAGIRDAYIRYKGFDNIALTVGNFKQPFGLEELTSSANITFIERSAGTNPFIQGRVIGLGIDWKNKYGGLSAGLFGDSPNSTSNDDEGYSYVARGYITPFNDENLLHLGASIRHAIPDSASDSVRFRERPETKLTNGELIVDTGTISNVDSTTSYGLEFLAGHGSFSLQSEYIFTDISRNNANDYNLSGGYVAASYFLTGENRNYKKGKANSITPNSQFSLDNGGYGAWEVALRYSMLDLNDGALAGGEYNGTTIALNWYPNKTTRLMANYIFADSDGNGVTPNDDPQILLFRVQFSY